jgi:UDP-N-acetylglucosamine diphosphorylase/glucosamine-1-phosphate N-acetyltransferase
MNLCLFEDRYYRKLLPLVYLRPVYDLRCGILLLREKIIRRFPKANVNVHTRPYLAESVRRSAPGIAVNHLPEEADQVLFINGRLLMTDEVAEQLEHEDEDRVYTHEEQVVAVRLSGNNLERVAGLLSDHVFDADDFSHLPVQEIEATLITYPWELIRHNGEQITADFAHLNPETIGAKEHQYPGVHLIHPEQIALSPGVRLKPGVVLDADGGPIYLGENVKVLPNAVIEGPAFVGDNSLIKVGAKIYENTSIGEVCKVGGEVEESIIHSYSNKQHEGFLGHAYLGSWVNIGADTNNSDLKNDYGMVKMYADGEFVDTGSQFVGLVMGDHSKSGINSMFNTGTVVGMNCNLFGAGLPPKFVPSFTWGSADGGYTTYRLDKALQVAERMQARRRVPFTELDRTLFETVFKLTAEERRRAGMGED